MVRRPVLPVIFATMLLASVAQAVDGTVELKSFTKFALADPSTNITITAEVRDGQGRQVPDGTQILFESTLGTFRQRIVNTVNGFASAVLQGGTEPGTAKITASAIAFRATGTLSIDFVKDRALLSSAKEFFDVTSPKYLSYSPDFKIIAAASGGRPVTFLYRDIRVDAADLQVQINNYILKAKRAALKFGNVNQEFTELRMDLRQRTGEGTAIVPRPKRRLAIRRFALVTVTDMIPSLGPVKVSREGVVPAEMAAPPTAYQFEDISNSQSFITARKVIAYPARELQFQKANVYLGDQKVLSVPLFQMSPFSSEPVLTDQYVNVSSNQLAINYPYYLSLKPGQSSALRLRTGTAYGSGGGRSGGVFMDYEMNWYRGDESFGGLAVTGMGRKDYGVSLRQFRRFDTKTEGQFQVDLPSARSVFASTNLRRQLPKWSASYSGNLGHNIRGNYFKNQQHYLTLEHDPVPIKKLPFRLFYGLSASINDYRSPQFSSSQTSAGFRTRAQSDALKLSKRTTFYTNFELSALTGKNTRKGLTTGADATVYTSLSSTQLARISYNYLDDPFNAGYLGRHRISAETSYTRGRFDIRFFGQKSLDIDRLNYTLSSSYRLGKRFRLEANYAADRFRGISYNNTFLLLGYNLGVREIGISWSSRNKRFGIEILGSGLR